MNGLKSRATALALAGLPAAWAQAPLLQDGSAVLRQAQRAWTAGEEPLPPLSLPSLELGLGGAGSGGPYAPLIGGEGLGQSTQGWGLGLQGRYVQGGWSVSATVLTLRNGAHTSSLLQRGAMAYQAESGWRAALEQAPFAWGSGLNGGDLLGDNARPFPRLSLTTPVVPLPLGRWRLEAFAGRLERNRPIPEWLPDRNARLTARAGGLDLQSPLIWGGLLRATFASLVEARLGALAMEGGRDALGHPAPAGAARISALAELRVRIPDLARWLGARGAAATVSRSATREDRSLGLSSGRNLAGLQLVWDSWDLALEYAGAAPLDAPATFTRPAHLAGWSTHGDPLQPAFGRETITRTVEWGLPLFLEGQGRIKAIRSTSAKPYPPGNGFWFLQCEAQWRTPTGRIGASLASRRNDAAGAVASWGWAFSLFQGFRVF